MVFKILFLNNLVFWKEVIMYYKIREKKIFYDMYG